MTDRELLELAAKAAGMSPASFDGRNVGWYDPRRGTTGAWNPLSDDGDAFRLAVKLCMNIEITDSYVFACSVGNFSEPAKPDREAAVRRAIVRAAAEIGKNASA